MWTLKYNGQTKSLADWGLTDLIRERNSLAADTVTLVADGMEMDAADLFSYGSIVEVFKPDGSRWFYGRVEPIERNGTPSKENHFYRLAGVWWWLENCPYKQIWLIPNGQFETSHVFLNLTYDLKNYPTGKLTTGQQIAGAIAFAISRGAPMQIGAMAPWATPPIDECKCIQCHEVIHKMFRWEPDFVSYVDYSTTPPTIHFKKSVAANLDPAAANSASLLLTPKSIDLNAGAPLENITVKPRPDWQRPYVYLQFEQINDNFLSIIEDYWPQPLPLTGPESFAGIDQILTLPGSKTSKQSANITSRGFDITSADTWKLWKPELTAPQIKSVVIQTTGNTYAKPQIQSLDGSNYLFANAFELTEGEHADWMSGAANITGQRVRASAYATVTLLNGSTKTEQLNFDFTAISFNTKNSPKLITTTTVTAWGDLVPIGLAKIIWQACQALACEGECSSVEPEVSGWLAMENCLNFISAKQPAWASLNALVQSTSEHALKGETKAHFGAPQHLTAGQIVDMLRASRLRNIQIDPVTILGGFLGDGTTQHGRRTHAKSVSGGAGHKTFDAVSASPDPAIPSDNNNLGSITHDSGQTPAGSPTANPIQSIWSGAKTDGSVTIRLGKDPKDNTGADGADLAIYEIAGQKDASQKPIKILASAAIGLGCSEYDFRLNYPPGSIVFYSPTNASGFNPDGSGAGVTLNGDINISAFYWTEHGIAKAGDAAAGAINGGNAVGAQNVPGYPKQNDWVLISFQPLKLAVCKVAADGSTLNQDYWFNAYGPLND